MHIPEIIEVKDQLEELKKEGMIDSWELPYENILTRRSAAIFFITPKGDNMAKIANALKKYENFSYRENTEKKLSDLVYRVTFNLEEKEINENKELETNEQA